MTSVDDPFTFSLPGCSELGETGFEQCQSETTLNQAGTTHIFCVSGRTKRARTNYGGFLLKTRKLECVKVLTR
jgi:hypothetical protein